MSRGLTKAWTPTLHDKRDYQNITCIAMQNDIQSVSSHQTLIYFHSKFCFEK